MLCYRCGSEATRRCGWLCLLALLLPVVVAAQPARPRVVVKSAALAPYAAVVAGFNAEVRAEVVEVTLEDSAAAAVRAFQRIAAQKPLVLALGPLAASTARRTLGENVPILFAMVPYSLELSIVPLEADAQAKADKVLAGAKDKVDALLRVADKTVGNAAVVQELIAFATTQRLPLVGLTPSQVGEGATLALAPNPIAIGQQAGRLANRIVHEKVNPGALAVAQPEGLELAINLPAAGKLGGSRDVVLELLRFAAKRDFPVRVFE